jgi:hypothetical protein
MGTSGVFVNVCQQFVISLMIIKFLPVKHNT